MIQKSLHPPEKFLNTNVKYFEGEVNKVLIQNMPFDEVEQLVALEKVLIGEKHSKICIVYSVEIIIFLNVSYYFSYRYAT